MSLHAIAIVFSTKLLPLLYAIIGFGLLITIHECGHFFFCKMFGIHTPTFSIGMGPKLIERKIGNTNFRIAALPLGGYVEIAGLAEVGQGAQEHAHVAGETSFSKKPYWQKLLVLSGGVLFNILFAYFVYMIVFFVGLPKKTVAMIIKPTISSETTDTFGIKPKDKIISVNDVTLSEEPKKLIHQIHTHLLETLSGKAVKPITLNLLRDEKQVTETITVDTPELKEQFLNCFELKATPIEGEYEKYPLFQAIGKGVETVNGVIINIFTSIKYLISNRTLKGAGGPVMIISKTFETAQQGFFPLLMFLAFISINLAIINILPLGALDGGQILFATIEAIIRREIPEIVRLIVNIASWVLLLSLILYLTYQDILRILRFR